MMAFTEEQALELSAKLSVKHVRTRESNGRMLAYIEGWHTIAEANRIFGYDAWDRNTVSAACVWSGTHRGGYVCAYTAKVRITVRAGETRIVREGSGTGEGKGLTPGEAHDIALKSAETDATKRALATFGNPFGLALYDKEMKGVRNAAKIRISGVSADEDSRWSFRSRADDPVQNFETPEAFVAALEESLSQSASLGALFDMWALNLETVELLGRSEGKDAVKTLHAHLKAHAVRLAGETPGRNGGDTVEINGAITGSGETAGIDKSALHLAEPKRIRSKEHLTFVANQPCLLCGRTPSQAHHLRFAQPRALARKVSDEYVVPLCALHHSELHKVGDERRWWKIKNIDPLLVADALWKQNTGGEREKPGDHRLVHSQQST